MNRFCSMIWCGPWLGSEDERITALVLELENLDLDESDH